MRSSLVGRPNVYNILAAVAVAVALDLPTDAIERGITALDRVPGRFQVVSSPDDDVTVIVDYAHTDDALRNLLETARPLAAGRIITVFGCGGDRDRTKRPLMGAVAGRLSDVILITSDNPRGEDPCPHHRGNAARHHAGHASRPRAAHPARSSIGARPSTRRSRSPARGSRAHCRQGTREVPGDRRPDRSPSTTWTWPSRPWLVVVPGRV